MLNRQNLLVLATALGLSVWAINGCDGSNTEVRPLDSDQVDTTPAESSDQVQPPAEQTKADELTHEPTANRSSP